MRSRKFASAGAVALAASAVLTSAASASAVEADAGPVASARLIGGVPAPASVTFVGALMFDAEREGVHDALTCGSVVVGRQWLLSAAQCVADLGVPGEFPAKDKKFHVRVGSLDRTAGGSTANVDGIYLNPHWTGEVNPPRKAGDAVMLHVDRPLDVPVVRMAWWTPPPGSVQRTYSWGATVPAAQPDRDKLPTMLQQLDLTVLPKPQCADAGITNGEFCTSHKNGTGPAYGDAGGPTIVYDRHGRPYVTGLDSRGGSPVPGQANTAFTSVAAYRDWAEDVMDDHT
ncbi:trypsin-like serine protease [Amycolatopsis rubida]|uniref:Trypsin-like serine protease n=1 Tax=Amycolatopsis rubida TaxID=112413 RepID=A0ABX0BMD1_9PSEU|nr:MULTISPECIES: trypsin-like serine protease [Amycolatopsis]MYW91812.1 trypsin-like serine protease [Amycolatopsis rubida]NEC56797.1 trypsin-like serine protease [Amycolatopsis rubida]OAP19939.1 Trypsin [Amycolatopsis sp. M39]